MLLQAPSWACLAYLDVEESTYVSSIWVKSEVFFALLLAVVLANPAAGRACVIHLSSKAESKYIAGGGEKKKACKQANSFYTFGKEPQTCGNKWKTWLKTSLVPEFHLFASVCVACYLYFLLGDGQCLKSASGAENTHSLLRWMDVPRSTKHLMCPR